MLFRSTPPRFVTGWVCGVLPRSVPPSPSPSPYASLVSLRVGLRGCDLVGASWSGRVGAMSYRRVDAVPTRHVVVVAARRGRTSYGRRVNALCASGESTRGVVVESTRPHRGRASDGGCRVDASWLRVGWSLHRRAVCEGKTGSEKRNEKEIREKKRTFIH